MLMTYSLISLVALSSLTIATPAIAQDADTMASSDWTRSNYVVALDDDRGIEVEHVIAQNFSDDGTPEAGSLGFACVNETLHVMFSYEDVALDQAFKDAWTERRAKSRVGTLSINGDSQKRGGFTDLRDTKLYMSLSPSDKRNLYRAVVTGQDMSVRVRNETVEIKAPAVNNDFREFGADCGLGILAGDSE